MYPECPEGYRIGAAVGGWHAGAGEIVAMVP
jgi:hypothetical protein